MRVHSETGQPPLARWRRRAAPVPHRRRSWIAEAFLWEDYPHRGRQDRHDQLHGNRYQTDPALAGRKVEVLLQPVRPDRRDRVRWRGAGHGRGGAARDRPALPPQGLAPAAPAPAAPTGIDYLRMVAEAHREQQAGSINFAALAGGGHDRPAAGGDQAGPGEPR